MGGSYTTRVGHRVDYETSVYEISNVISPEEWEAWIHIRLGICSQGWRASSNHGLAPRNMLESKSYWSRGPGSESDEVQHNSGLELHQSQSRATRVASELHQSCIRDNGFQSLGAGR